MPLFWHILLRFGELLHTLSETWLIINAFAERQKLMFQTAPFYHAVAAPGIDPGLWRDEWFWMSRQAEIISLKPHSFTLHHSLSNRRPNGCDPTGFLKGTHPADVVAMRESRAVFEPLKQKEKREHAKTL
jgi:hypothetical protein